MTSTGTAPIRQHDAASLRGGLESLNHAGHRMTVLQATGLGTASTVIDLVRRNQMVLLNCSALDSRLTQRIVDMVSGGICAMEGQVRQISPEVLMACSALTAIDEDDF